MVSVLDVEAVPRSETSTSETNRYNLPRIFTTWFLTTGCFSVFIVYCKAAPLIWLLDGSFLLVETNPKLNLETLWELLMSSLKLSIKWFHMEITNLPARFWCLEGPNRVWDRCTVDLAHPCRPLVPPFRVPLAAAVLLHCLVAAESSILLRTRCCTVPMWHPIPLLSPLPPATCTLKLTPSSLFENIFYVCFAALLKQFLKLKLFKIVYGLKVAYSFMNLM